VVRRCQGFWFIIPDNGMQDVLLHVTCLRPRRLPDHFGRHRIVALIQRRERGYQAFKILSMDQSTALHPSQMPPAAPMSRSPPPAVWNGRSSNGSTAPRVLVF